jgi:hypothetical protein
MTKSGMPRKIGYAARPGSGPKNRRCNTCVHAQRVRSGTRISWKCDIVSYLWDDTDRTDIKPAAPACSEWTRKPFVAPKEFDLA